MCSKLRVEQPGQLLQFKPGCQGFVKRNVHALLHSILSNPSYYRSKQTAEENAVISDVCIQAGQLTMSAEELQKKLKDV